MTFLKRLFGSLNISDSVQALNAMLHADDWTSWKQHANRENVPLDLWVRKNIVHAMESCPKVLAYWKMGQSNDVDERVPYYVGLALEEFSDEQKTAFLSGVCSGNAQTSLFEYINKKASNWTVLSPAWIGPPGSDLRRAVVNRGWSDTYLLDQVPQFLSQPGAERWAQWVPYAHSIAFLYNSELGADDKRHIRAEVSEPGKIIGHAWARAEDTALVQSLSKCMPECLCVFTPHSRAAPVSPELQERMDALVNVHIGLGMTDTLTTMALNGTLLSTCDNATMAIALPALDMAALIL